MLYPSYCGATAEQRLKEVRERPDYKEVGNGSLVDQRGVDLGDAPSRLRAAVMASRFAANALRGHMSFLSSY